MDVIPGGNGYPFYPNGIHEQRGKTLCLLPCGPHDDLQLHLLELIGNPDELADLLAGNDRRVYFHDLYLLPGQYIAINLLLHYQSKV